MEAAMTALMGVAGDNEAMKTFLLSRGHSEVLSMLTTPKMSCKGFAEKMSCWQRNREETGGNSQRIQPAGDQAV